MSSIAQIAAREETNKTRIAQERAITDARIANEEMTRQREIARPIKAIDEAEIAAREAVEKAPHQSQRQTAQRFERIAAHRSDSTSCDVASVRQDALDAANIAAQGGNRGGKRIAQ